MGTMSLVMTLFALLLTGVIKSDAKYSISLGPNPVTFTCESSSGKMDSVGWMFKENVQKVFGVSATSEEPKCNDETGNLPPNFSFTCSNTTGRYTLTIDSIVCSDYIGTWMCQNVYLGIDTSDPVNLTTCLWPSGTEAGPTTKSSTSTSANTVKVWNFHAAALTIIVIAILLDFQ